MKIEGRTTDHTMDVTEDGRGRTSGETDVAYAGVNERGYTYICSQTAAGAADCIGYLKNEMENYNIYVDEVDIEAAGDETVTIYGDADGTPGGAPTTVTCYSKVAGKAALTTAQVTALEDPDITGLTQTLPIGG